MRAGVCDRRTRPSPRDLEEMAARSGSCGLAVNHQHLELRERQHGLIADPSRIYHHIRRLFAYVRSFTGPSGDPFTIRSQGGNEMGSTATILHADLDAFYASVEQLLDPRLRGKPIAVGGGVVLAASYEARAFGVRSGMPGRRARQLCPDLVFVGGHFDEYQRLGDAAIGILNDFTPSIERISIDEAFADVAGCTHLFGSPAEIATRVRARVRAELGLPISIGVARTKHLAKIASQVAKPDGLVVVDPDTELEFLHELPVALMWGVGPATEARLAKIGVTTIGQLAESSPKSVERLLGHAVGRK